MLHGERDAPVESPARLAPVVSALLGHRNVAVVTLFDPWQKWNSAGRLVLEKAHIDVVSVSRYGERIEYCGRLII